MQRDSALRRIGWFRSALENSPVDATGTALPWITYPAIAFLAKRVQRHMRVFEYGAGSSTAWWAGRVEKVVSVENDARWYERVKRTAPPNVVVHFVPLEADGAYSRAVGDSGDRFHVIVIDGRDRVNCVKHSVDALTEDGVILFDNSERDAYRPALEFCETRGFRRIEFQGLVPAERGLGETSILYREGNCLGI
jgi:tRNA A58 N-methylase Trm61